MTATVYHVTAGYPKTDLTAALQATAAYEGFVTISLPDKWPYQRMSTIDKFLLMRAFITLNGVRDQDFILFSDAYDVLILQSAYEIVRRFIAFDAGIVFNAETNFFPDKGRDPVRDAFNQSATSEFKYLNSGCYVGYAWAVREMLDWCLARAATRNPRDHALDQELAQDFWFECRQCQSGRVLIDSECEIFATLMGAEQMFSLYQGRVVGRSNHDTCVIHANGNKRNLAVLDGIYSLLYKENSGKGFVDLRILQSDGMICRYSADRRRIEVAEEPSSDSVFLLGLGSRISIALVPGYGVLTFHPAGAVSFGASILAEWEILSGVENPCTVHGYTLDVSFRGVAVPLNLFSAGWMGDLIRQIGEVGSQPIFAPRRR